MSSKESLSTTPRSESLVSIEEACAMVNVSRRTIYNWMNKGLINYVRTAGGRVRIVAETLFRPGAESPRV